MPRIELEAETIERLDKLRVEGQSYDDVVSELVDIYEAEGLTLQHGGDVV